MKLMKTGFFVIKICYSSSSNDPNITNTKNYISRTLNYIYTRKYMHAETLADKTIVFFEREVFKVVVMVTVLLAFY